MKPYWKYIIPLLLALAITLGLIQRGREPYLNNEAGNSSAQENAGSDKSLEQYYRQAQDLSAPQTTTARAAFLAVGDIMLSRNVAATINEAKDPSLPFHPLTPLFQSVDFSVGNLESPVGNVVGGHSLVFGAPYQYFSGLKENKFSVLNLANNHALDQGVKGLAETQRTLDELNIQYVGAGEDLDAAWQPAAVLVNGLQICFVGASYSSINDNGKATNNYVARIEDTERLKASLAMARRQCDFVAAAMHAGTEYTRKPNQAQIDFAHTAIDYGADIVIGAHPHWVQTTEKYQGKYIFYSLGNFIFDQMWSQDTKEGLALKITVSKTKNTSMATPGAATIDDIQGARQPAAIEAIELIPVIIENYSTPRAANADEAKKILEKMGETSNILK